MKKSILLVTAVALLVGSSSFAGSTEAAKGATAPVAPVAAVNTNTTGTSTAGLTANANTATKAAPVKVMGKKGGKKKKSAK